MYKAQAKLDKAVIKARSAMVKNHIINTSYNQAHIDYSYVDGDFAINVRHRRTTIRASLKLAIQFMIRRNRNEIKPKTDAHLIAAYSYWSKRVGLTDEDINSTWARTIKRTQSISL